MHLSRLEIQNLRCLKAVPELEFHPELNIITGANAAGKTTLLESIDLLARGRSFRSSRPRELITRGESGYLLRGQVCRRNSDEGEEEVFWLSQSRTPETLELRCDREPLSGLASLAARLAVQSIHPDSQALVHGAPRRRRSWLDWGVFHVEPAYRPVWAAYQRALKQRNAALKARQDPQPWNATLAEAGEAIDQYRCNYLDEVRDSIDGFAQILLPGQELNFQYRPGFDREEGLQKSLDTASAASRPALATEAGPHRADLEWTLDGMPAAHCASRGQTKLLVSCLLLGQVVLFQELRNQNCVLLVDDLASELDATRMGRMMEALSRCEAQLFASCVGEESGVFPLASGGQMFHVEQGAISLT